jgi:uncharacterized protein (TIGR01777 family)
MKILVTGASGLIGTALVSSLSVSGHEVTRLIRGQPVSGEMVARWDPLAGSIDISAIEGIDAVVHLAGENIAARWTPAKKAQIRDSRVKGTQLLCEALTRVSSPPRVLVSASAVGYYGDRGETILTEDSPPGQGFLAEVCRAWEAATEPARQHGLRVVQVRLGVVLSATGGALAKMLPPFKLGLGGTLGSGQQYMSWIALDDVVGAIQHALGTEALQGPTNAVVPQAVTNREFTETLGKVLRRPTAIPLPAFAARLMFGEMADELLLASVRVQPTKLLASGYQFRYPELETALQHVLAR